MSGGVKSGLIFGLASIIVVGGLTIIPTLGQLCCGPLAALLLGGVAGYLGVRWSGPSAGVGQGAIAGGISGIGALIGTIIGFILYIALVRAIPETRQILEDTLRQQSGAERLTAEDIDLLMSIAGPLGGFCFGILWLLFALGTGVLGAWIATRQRGGEQPQPPITMPPPAA
ncbi:MAG: hypothetical protein DIU80_014235 [Chloroflexota bacterium]|nr:MAG: hypothetical protein DIU80_10550 [Chloroflexota bacterium]